MLLLVNLRNLQSEWQDHYKEKAFPSLVCRWSSVAHSSDFRLSSQNQHCASLSMMDLLGELKSIYLFLLNSFTPRRKCEHKKWNILWGALEHIFMFEIKRTLKLNMLKGGYFSVFYSPEFRPPILAYLGSNVYLVYNFLHPASQRRAISFPCLPTYMSLWRCGPFCTSGEFQGYICFILRHFSNCP